uniref:Odorant-binding protein A10-like protein n=1 Tax=Acartia pacifica TaxID=335913 RepID=R9TEV0_ACAPC|nr:odorant-binding protein A10-like protein [Acartia pacifica]
MVSYLFKMIKVILAMFLFLSIASAAKCKVDSEVKFILNNFNKRAVEKNVDCVVGAGRCDSLGQRLKSEAPAAVRGRCGQNCSCEQIQVRLVVNKLKREFPGQWRRVEQQFSR